MTVWWHDGSGADSALLSLVNKPTAFSLILLIIDLLWLVRVINGSKNWTHILSPDLF